MNTKLILSAQYMVVIMTIIPLNRCISVYVIDPMPKILVYFFAFFAFLATVYNSKINTLIFF